MSTNSEYYKEWYAKNREKRAITRSSRYHNEPSYKARVLALSRTSRERSKKNKIAVQDRIPRFKILEAEIQGVRKKVFTIGAISALLGISKQALRLWEKNGTIPASPLKDGYGCRLYSALMILEIESILVGLGKLTEIPKHTLQGRLLQIQLADGTVKDVWLFRVGVASRIAGISVATFSSLEEKGMIPDTKILGTKKCQRLYTREMIESIKQGLQKGPHTIENADRIKNFTTVEWEKLGFNKARKVDNV